MSFKNYSLCISAIFAMSFVSYAQEKPLDDVKRHVPTSKESAKESAKQLAKRVELSKQKRSAMFKRALQTRETHTQYLSGIQSGKINPFQSFFDVYPSLTKDLAQVQQIHQQWTTETNDNTKTLLKNDLLNKLQGIGRWLRPADYIESFDGVLSKDELAELEGLERNPDRRPANLSQSKSKLEYAGPRSSYYTLQLLPLPVVVKAPAGARVFLQATAGGAFENGLSIIEKTADEQGKVSTYFLSRGDAAGFTQIEIVSPECSNTLYYDIYVMGLAINFPAFLNDQRMQQLKDQSPEQINKMLKQFSDLEFTELKKRAIEKAISGATSIK